MSWLLPRAGVRGRDVIAPDEGDIRRPLSRREIEVAVEESPQPHHDLGVVGLGHVRQKLVMGTQALSLRGSGRVQGQER